MGKPLMMSTQSPQSEQPAPRTGLVHVHARRHGPRNRPPAVRLSFLKIESRRAETPVQSRFRYDPTIPDSWNRASILALAEELEPDLQRLMYVVPRGVFRGVGIA